MNNNNPFYSRFGQARKKHFIKRPAVLLFSVATLSFLLSLIGYAMNWITAAQLLMNIVILGAIAVAGYATYCTVCKQANSTLARQHDYFHRILESRHESIVVVDRELRIHDLNENFLKWTGKRREEVIGQPCYAVSHGRATPCSDEADQHCPVSYAFKTGEHRSCVHRHFRLTGEPFDVEISAIPLQKENGKVSLVVETMRDITELTHLKALFLQAQKMEAVGRLAGGMAHDFNNLMNVVIGYSEMLLHKMGPQDASRAGLENILDAGERAATLTRQLLAFSRKQIIEPKILNLNSVIANMDKILRRIIGEDIDLVSRPANDLGHVKADLGMIEQIIMNLAVNARDAMPEGGKLTIETANVELDERYVNVHQGSKPGPHVMIAVSDTGSGMTLEVKARIFEPFFTTKEIGKGTGLGLSTVFGIVKQHNGYVMAYSEPEKGTSFKVYLPRVEHDEDAMRKKTSGKVIGGNETILLVEDDEGLRTMAGMMLEELGYTVLSYASPAEALESLTESSNGIALLFTDVVMPGMNGKTLAEHVQLSKPGIKVLFTSGYPDNAVVHQGVLDPGSLFIQKPFTSAVLAKKVREALDR